MQWNVLDNRVTGLLWRDCVKNEPVKQICKLLEDLIESSGGKKT